jgi:hypothetical protein
VPNATYLPSPAEIAAGGVTLTFSSNDPAGPCGAFADQMHITINPVAVANAGPDQIVCANSPQAQLAGSVFGSASGGTWSGGAGSYQPNPGSLTARYTPSAGEIAAGFVVLTLTTNDPAGPCPPVSDQVRITIDPLTIVNAGPDQEVCATSPQVHLAGSVSGTVTTGSWGGGTGSFSPSASALNATYSPSPAEIAAGSVTLVLTSSPSSRPCPPASDAITITIRPAATVNAGADPITCGASPQVQLSGSVGGAATGAVWSGGGGTFSPNPQTLNAIYTPTPGEVANRSVTLTLTTNDPAGPCGPVSDQVKITYDQPSVSVPSRTVCVGIPSGTLCANAGNGVPPYTYRWGNGATTQCIAVADTGRYDVTITDSKGCTATSSGYFHRRDCIGMLAHTSTTCGSFQDGTGEPFLSNDVNYALRDGKISTIAPGVFFYFTKVIAPRADFTIVIEQLKSNPIFPFCEIQQGQITLYDASCGNLGSGDETSPGQASVAVHGATPGQFLVVGVKYSLKNLIGTPMDPNGGCHYAFLTKVDGHVVDSDPDGLDIGFPYVTGVGDEPGSGFDDLVPMRPSPNPFRTTMRMSYVVMTPEEVVNIRVYDLAGRLVRTLANGPMLPGRYAVAWDGRDEGGAVIRSGIYFVRAQIGAKSHRAQVVFVQ